MDRFEIKRRLKREIVKLLRLFKYGFSQFFNKEDNKQIRIKEITEYWFELHCEFDRLRGKEVKLGFREKYRDLTYPYPHYIEIDFIPSKFYDWIKGQRF